jgi:hypothetical protein
MICPIDDHEKRQTLGLVPSVVVPELTGIFPALPVESRLIPVSAI